MRATISLLMLTAVACGGSSEPSVITPQLQIVAGDAQVDTVGQTLPVQLGAQLMNAATGDPIPGRILQWTVVGNSGALFVSVSQTGNDGIARNSWTLGTTPGEQKVTARYIDPDTGLPVTLDTAFATATAGKPTAMWTETNGGNANDKQTIGLTYGFWDQYSNPTDACPPVTWQIAGAAGNTVTMPSLAELPNHVWVQDVVIEGSTVATITFTPGAACVTNVVGAISVHYTP